MRSINKVILIGNLTRDPELRRTKKNTPVCSFGLATNNRDEQERAVLSLHLLQICMVYINTLLVQNILKEKEWRDRLQPEDFRGLTPLFYGHVNPYGRLELNMDERIAIE